MFDTTEELIFYYIIYKTINQDYISQIILLKSWKHLLIPQLRNQAYQVRPNALHRDSKIKNALTKFGHLIILRLEMNLKTFRLKAYY